MFYSRKNISKNHTIQLICNIIISRPQRQNVVTLIVRNTRDNSRTRTSDTTLHLFLPLNVPPAPKNTRPPTQRVHTPPCTCGYCARPVSVAREPPHGTYASSRESSITNRKTYIKTIATEPEIDVKYPAGYDMCFCIVTY